MQVVSFLKRLDLNEPNRKANQSQS